VATGYERPDFAAAAELETLVRHLLDELGGWRRRCLKAEADLQAVQGAGGGGAGVAGLRDRVVQLETENRTLRHRVDAARERVQALVGRLSFLEEQGGSA
jgi:hypothetical protein